MVYNEIYIKDKVSKTAEEMANVLLKYLGYFKETDEALKIKAELLSTAMLNPFIIYNSSPRGLMMSGNFAHTLAINDPDEKIVVTGGERELGKAAITKKIEHDSLVEDVITRTKNGFTNGEEPLEYLIVYRDLETDEIESLEITRFSRLHVYFGFEFIIDHEYIQSLMKGDVIPAGKILAHPPGLNPETGAYSFGKNLNVALMSLDGVGEDGMIVSESCLDKLQFKIIENRKHGSGSESFLLNRYGKDGEYKPFPEIGEKINEDSILLASRKYDDELGPALYSKSDVAETPNPVFDNVVYVKGPNGIVIDVKAWYSQKRKQMALKGTDELLNKYVDGYMKFNKSVLSSYYKLNDENKVNSNDDLVVGRKYNNKIVQANNVVTSGEQHSKVKKNHRRDKLDLYYLEFDVLFNVRPSIKNKITGMAGDKQI